jgi:hypothetical protein
MIVAVQVPQRGGRRACRWQESHAAARFSVLLAAAATEATESWE